jgi:uncharacterized Zn-binding protein involved in type VI secretion
MPGIVRNHTDSAGGALIGTGNPTVFVNGQTAAVLNDAVTGHGVALHASPVMVQASSTVFFNSIAVCRAGDQANCGHAATGSSNVNAG